eukprot:1156565-Pelagomonas_calceolata.AAC.1
MQRTLGGCAAILAAAAAFRSAMVSLGLLSPDALAAAVVAAPLLGPATSVSPPDAGAPALTAPSLGPSGEGLATWCASPAAGGAGGCGGCGGAAGGAPAGGPAAAPPFRRCLTSGVTSCSANCCMHSGLATHAPRSWSKSAAWGKDACVHVCVCLSARAR